MTLDELKISELISRFNHEVRSPFTATFGFINLLRDETISLDSKESKEIVSRVYLSQQKVFSIVELLILLSKVESGDFEHEITYFDLNKEIQTLIDSTRLQHPNIKIESSEGAREHSTITQDINVFRKLIDVFLQALVLLSGDIIIEVEDHYSNENKLRINVKFISKSSDSKILNILSNKDVENSLIKQNILISFRLILFYKLFTHLKGTLSLSRPDTGDYAIELIIPYFYGTK